jgi:hypothetical protein
MRSNFAIAALALAAISTFASSEAFAKKTCWNLRAKCAVQVGGSCDPVADRYQYAAHQTEAFNACVAKGGKK